MAENNDHDLLIRLDTKMDRASQDLKEVSASVETVRHDVSILSDSMETKIQAAISGKADTMRVNELKLESDKLHDDHESRLRRLEKYVWSALGALAIVQALMGVALAIWKH